jgi:hypothetical protein
MGEVATLGGLKDETVKRLLMIGKRSGLKPFFGHPKAMIALREEAARRGIYATRSEEAIIEKAVFARMEERGNGREGNKQRARTR